MAWLIAAGCVVLVHLTAIIVGRKTTTTPHRVAFTSGIAGFFSFPVVVYFGLKSFCIAGMCGHVDNTWLYLALAVFVGLALLSTGSSLLLMARRSHA